MSDISDSSDLLIEDALHLTLDFDFEDTIDRVQLEHEIVGFETVKVTRLDQMVGGMLGKDVNRTALIVVCHAEIAYKALNIDPRLAGLLPCTTIVYEDDEEAVHVHHVSVTKAMKELGFVPEEKDSLNELIELTGEKMNKVWENLRTYNKNE